jgi:hypothetical protein
MPKGHYGRQMPPGSLPGDEYGDGHQQVNPAFSRRTNSNILNRHTTDGNIGAYEAEYGVPGVPGDKSVPSGGPRRSLYRDADAFYGAQKRSFDQVNSEFRQLFGDEIATQVLDEVMRMAAFQDSGGQLQLPDHMTNGDYGGGSLPRPDFGDQQPHTTGPTGDGDLAALEQYYGYPVSANNLTGNPNAPVRNLPNGYDNHKGQLRRLPKGRTRMTER